MNGRFVIHIKAGAYFEYLDIARSKTMLMLVGDGLENTYIKGNRSVGGGWTTFQSGTVGEFNFLLSFSANIIVIAVILFHCLGSFSFHVDCPVFCKRLVRFCFALPP